MNQPLSTESPCSVDSGFIALEMITVFRRILALPLLLSLSLIPTALPAHADEDAVLSVAPLNHVKEGYFEISAKPGESVDLSLQVSTSTDISLHSYVAPAVPMTNGGFSAGEQDKPVGTSAWFSYDNEPFLLPAGQRELTYHLLIPEDASSGEHAAAVVIETEAQKVNETFDHRYQQVVPVNIVVDGEVIPEFDSNGEVTHWEGTEGSLLSFGITNDGNKHVSPAGSVEIFDSSNSLVSTADLTMGSIYTGTTATAQVGLAEPLLPGDYRLRTSLKDQGSDTSTTFERPFIVEKQEQVSSGKSGLAKVQQQVNDTDWLLPVIAGLLSLILAGVIVLLFRRRRTAR